MARNAPTGTNPILARPFAATKRKITVKPTPGQINAVVSRALAKAQDPELKRLIANVPAVIHRIRGGATGLFVVASSRGFATYLTTATECTCPYFTGSPHVEHGNRACKHTIAVRALLALLPPALALHIRAGDDQQAMSYAVAHPWTTLINDSPGATETALYDPGTGFNCAMRLHNGLYTAAGHSEAPWLYQWWSWAELPQPNAPAPADAAYNLAAAAAAEATPTLTALLARYAPAAQPPA
jgi:hypothetical protein